LYHKLQIRKRKKIMADEIRHVEKPRWFFNAKEENCVSLKF